MTAERWSLRACSKRMYGFWREDGRISSILIFSICRFRDVACRAFDAFAEKRRTNSCRSEICALALANADAQSPDLLAGQSLTQLAREFARAAGCRTSPPSTGQPPCVPQTKAEEKKPKEIKIQ